MADEKLHENIATVDEVVDATAATATEDRDKAADGKTSDENASTVDDSTGSDTEAKAGKDTVTKNTGKKDTEEEEEEDASLGFPLDKVEAVLNSTVDEATVSAQMRRMMQRQAENTRRVEESIKGTKANPGWFVPLFCILMVIGLVWAVVYYLNAQYPIPGIGAWNLLIAFAIIMVGFLMTMWWR